jgi:hypothetical protein
MVIEKLVGKKIYFNASHLGLNGFLTATIIEDGDDSDYPNYILVIGVYSNGRKVWLNKSILKNKDTKIMEAIDGNKENKENKNN